MDANWLTRIGGSLIALLTVFSKIIVCHISFGVGNTDEVLKMDYGKECSKDIDNSCLNGGACFDSNDAISLA